MHSTRVLIHRLVSLYRSGSSSTPQQPPKVKVVLSMFVSRYFPANMFGTTGELEVAVYRTACECVECLNIVCGATSAATTTTTSVVYFELLKTFHHSLMRYIEAFELYNSAGLTRSLYCSYCFYYYYYCFCSHRLIVVVAVGSPTRSKCSALQKPILSTLRLVRCYVNR